MKLSLSWRFILRAISVLSWVFSAIRVYHQPDLASLIGFILGTVSFIGSFFVSPKPIKILEISEEEKSARDRRNRTAMLKKVNNMWVEGVLKKSLHNAVLIEMGLEERKDAVDTPDRPWDMILQTKEQPNQVLPPGTNILDVFDDAEQALLILGEPGSGKTTMLLELARETIGRAGKDSTAPIPVVFNLSSWRESSQTIADWLVEELNTKYNIPKNIANTWVENNQLLLLFDGLDEAAAQRRNDCVKTINEFRREHSMQLAICSRTAEYEVLTTSLKLNSAVCIQPLTEKQVSDYFDKFGAELTAMRKMLQDDKPLRELSQSPLMLNIMTLAYGGASIEELQKLDTIEARREHLLNKYIDVMFNRVARTKNELYPRDKTTRWLSWLAEKMLQESQSVFLIERMQPTLLKTQAQQQKHTISTILILWLISGLIFGLIIGLIVGLISGLIFGLTLGLTGWLIGEHKKTIETVESLKWSWKEAKSGLIFGLIVGLISGLTVGLISRLIRGLIFGLIVATGVIIRKGLSYTEVKERTVPNQGIRQSIRNTVIVSSAIAIVLVPIIGLILAPLVVLGQNFGLNTGVARDNVGRLLAVALCLGPYLALVEYGGQPVIQHFVLRFILYRNGCLPWNMVRFLDYATERIFLQKVGGGYKFIHRLMQEHFASLR